MKGSSDCFSVTLHVGRIGHVGFGHGTAKGQAHIGPDSDSG